MTTPSPPDASDQALPQAPTAASAQQAAAADRQASATAAEESVEIELATPGIIAIEDLDKLEGADASDGAEGR